MARSGNRKAILLDDVEHLGDRGEVVSVSRGYLRNYLVPRKLAEEATPARVAEVERLAATRAAQEARTLDQANEIATLLTKTVLTIPARSGPDGRLYGSVTAADLADEIWRARKVRVDRRKIRLEEPIKALGSYLVEIDVFPEVRAAVKTQVVQVEGFDFDASAVAEAEAIAEAEAVVEAEEAVVEAEEAVDEAIDAVVDEAAAEQAD
jgi:large subunit ribosomal protein L9